MVYRPTANTEAKKADVRARIVRAAQALVAERGFMETQIAQVASAAGIANGTVYRYFPAKADLFAEVFRTASCHEVEVVSAVALVAGSVHERLAGAVRVFVERALRSRRLAWSLIAEPVDPLVDEERLKLRQAYAEVFAGLLNEGMALGEIAPQPAKLAAACLVGALAEALVGPLAPGEETLDEAARATLTDELVAFSLRAVG